MRTLLIFIAVLLASCSSRYTPTFTPYKIEVRQGNLITQDMRDKIRVGMSQTQVRAALGAPLVNDPYHANRWDYSYRLQQHGKLVENQLLTLYFENGSLARIDDATPLKAPVVPTPEQSDDK